MYLGLGLLIFAMFISSFTPQFASAAFTAPQRFPGGQNTKGTWCRDFVDHPISFTATPCPSGNMESSASGTTSISSFTTTPYPASSGGNVQSSASGTTSISSPTPSMTASTSSGGGDNKWSSPVIAALATIGFGIVGAIVAFLARKIRKRRKRAREDPEERMELQGLNTELLEAGAGPTPIATGNVINIAQIVQVVIEHFHGQI